MCGPSVPSSLGFTAAPGWWLVTMTRETHDYRTNLRNTGILALLTGLSFILIAMCAYIVVNRGILKASETLHNRMTTAITQAPVLFFDTNPAGRILNRFSKDIGSMDDVLPNFGLWAVQVSLSSLVSFLVPATTNPWLILVSFSIIAAVSIIGHYFVKSSRELKRLEAVRCSPVYSHIVETVLGIEVIHSSNMSAHFMRKYYRLVGFSG